MLEKEFFLRPTPEVAKDLLGKVLYRKTPEGIYRGIINETEAYHGMEDKACHCSKGRTKRTDIMFKEGGNIYIYLIYGMYHMLNLTTCKENFPGAVLIRGVAYPEFSKDGQIFEPLRLKTNGPGKLTKAFQIDKSLNTLPIHKKSGLWVVDEGITPKGFISTPRIGIDYAQEWKEKPWRFYVKPEKL